MEDDTGEVGKGQARGGQITVHNQERGRKWQSGPLLVSQCVLPLRLMENLPKPADLQPSLLPEHLVNHLLL